MIAILGFGGFGLYLFKLHAIAVEGNKIFEDRCLNVNPYLISYKNSFLKFTAALKADNENSTDQVTSYFDAYIAGMRSYVEAENKWLAMQEKFKNRWDFRLVEPWYVKQAGEYQWKMYEGYRDDAKYMLETFDNGERNEEIGAKFAEARDRRNKYSQLYSAFFEEASAIGDWRKIFISVPLPAGCRKENMEIPDTYGAMDWEERPANSVEPANPVNPQIDFQIPELSS